MLRFWLFFGLLCSIGFAGCGGGSGKAGPSLSKQYQEALKQTDASMRASKLVTIAEAQKKAGDTLGSDASLSAASEAAYSLSEPSSKANALNKVAAAYGRAGDTSTVKKLLKDTAKEIEKVPDPDIKIRTLADLASTTGLYLKNPDAAAEHLATAEKAAETIEGAQGKIAAQAKIAGAYARIERTKDAERILETVLAFARGLADPKEKAESLAAAASAQVSMKQTDAAKGTFDEAQQVAATIPADDQRGYALLHISQKLSLAGRKSDAKAALSKAQDAALKVTDSSLKAALVEEINGAATQLDR